MNITATVKSPLRYPGGKSRLAKRITDVIQANIGDRTLCSPFLGGASVELLAVRRGITVRGFDEDPALVNFWRGLLSNKEAVVEEAERLWDGRGADIEAFRATFRELKRFVEGSRTPRRELSTADAAAYWTLNRMSFSGTGTAGGPSPDRYTRGAVEKLGAFLTDAGKFKVAMGDFRRVIPEHPDAFLYLDPPYCVPYRQYACEFSRRDHADLCALLSSRGGWVLSYDNGEVVRELYKRFRIVEVSHNHSMGNWVKARYGGADAGEVLILADDIACEDEAAAAA